MSRALVSRAVLLGLLLIAAGSASIAFANADSLVGSSTDTLAASDAPAMLGAIDEHGRVGWECKPEQAAAAKRAAMAELPQAPH